MVSDKKDQKHDLINAFKWFIAIAITAGAVVANAWFSDVDGALRAAAGIVIFAVSAVVACQTTQGKMFLVFVREARNEMRKVVWPSREEAGKNAILITVIVFVVAGFLWAIDALLSWAIAWIVG